MKCSFPTDPRKFSSSKISCYTVIHWLTWLILSWPPATTTLASPQRMAWYPMATARSPDPQTMLMVVEGTFFGTPAAIAACLAGFWPHPVCSYVKWGGGNIKQDSVSSKQPNFDKNFKGRQNRFKLPHCTVMLWIQIHSHRNSTNTGHEWELFCQIQCSPKLPTFWH